MRLEQLEQIIAVENCKSLSKAARKLFVSQPSLSVTVNNLEEELGIQIFRRSNVGVMPTLEGKEILRLAHNVINEIEQMKGLRSGNASMRGEVKCVLTPVSVNSIAPELILRYHKQYPNVRLLILEQSPQEVIDQLSRGECNIAFSGCSEAQSAAMFRMMHSREIAFDITNYSVFKAVMSSRNPLAQKDSVSLAELGQYRGVEYSGNDIGNLAGTMGAKSFSEVLTVYDRETLKHLIARNEGVSIFPDFFSMNDLYFQQGLIVSRPVEDLTMRTIHYTMYSKKAPLSFLEEKLLETLRVILQECMSMDE